MKWIPVLMCIYWIAWGWYVTLTHRVEMALEENQHDQEDSGVNLTPEAPQTRESI